MEPGGELGDGSVVVAFYGDDAAANFECRAARARVLQRGSNATKDFDLDCVGYTCYHCLDATALVSAAEVVGTGHMNMQIDRATASVPRCPWWCHCCCLGRGCAHLEWREGVSAAVVWPV